jgi:hypothetical protein
MKIRSRAGRALGVLLVMGAAACGGEAVAGGARDAEVDATGDAAPGSPARLPDGPRASVALAAPVQGTVQFVSGVRLVSGGQAVAVGGSPTVQVSANGSDTVRVVQGRVAAVSYAAVRVVVREVSANVTGGLLIGGVSVTGTFNVDIAPGDSVVVERAVAIPASGDVRLVVDLNSATWLATANPVTRRVTAAALQSAVHVTTR